MNFAFGLRARICPCNRSAKVVPMASGDPIGDHVLNRQITLPTDLHSASDPTGAGVSYLLTYLRFSRLVVSCAPCSSMLSSPARSLGGFI